MLKVDFRKRMGLSDLNGHSKSMCTTGKVEGNDYHS